MTNFCTFSALKMPSMKRGGVGFLQKAGFWDKGDTCRGHSKSWKRMAPDESLGRPFQSLLMQGTALTALKDSI
jgi:hypothetical protein